MFRIFVIISLSSVIVSGFKKEVFEDSVTFTLFNGRGDAQKTTFNRNLTSHGCKADGNYAIVVHGWHESIRTPWVEDLISNLILNRGGCVIFMDYSRHGNAVNYNLLVRKFDSLAAVLLKKVKQIGNYDRLFMFGFSYGARLSFEAGARLGHQKIERIDACDPAGPGFEHRRTADPKVAAKNVACINTSIDKGTNIYNCHQNFRMGKCGLFQPAAGPPPLSSHGMCPYFYNSAFKNDFKADNVDNCVSNRMVKEMPEGFKMGYMEKRASSAIIGDIFVPTDRIKPWNVPGKSTRLQLEDDLNITTESSSENET